MSDALTTVSSLAGRPVMWEDLTWPEIDKLDRDTVLLLPLGATEQHGPHLPVNVDSVFAQSFCAYASAKTGAVVLPPIVYACSLGHTDHWPGTLSVWPDVLATTIRQIVHFLLSYKFRRLMLINSHWGNTSSARCAIDAIRFEHSSRISVGLRSTFDLTPSIWQQFTDDAADFHANRAETAMMMFLSPASVRTELLQNADDPDRTAGHVFTHVVPNTSTNGVTGFPSRANAADGKKLFIEIGDALVDVVHRARTETVPVARASRP